MLYMCNLAGCHETFTLKKDLARHKLFSQLHSDGRQPNTENPILICCESTCKSYGNIFSRQDNYDRHVRGVYPGCIWKVVIVRRILE